MFEMSEILKSSSVHMGTETTAFGLHKRPTGDSPGTHRSSEKGKQSTQHPVLLNQSNLLQRGNIFDLSCHKS